MSKKLKSGVYADNIPPASMVKVGNSLYNTEGQGYDAAVIRTRASSGRKPVVSQKKRRLRTLKDRVLDTWSVGK